jgi:putative pyruvate formate lyase activating enzyme
MIRLWDGIVDIYLPDMKYDDQENSERFSGARNYPEINRRIVVEMHRQVGTLRVDMDGIAVGGLLIRHLVLPGEVSGTDRVLEFVSGSISMDASVSLMGQYFPAHRAFSMPPLHRPVTVREYGMSKRLLKKYGLTHGWIQQK